MKKLIILTVFLIAGFLTTAKSETKIINHSGFEFGFFYSNLAPYGTWMELDAGLIVWRPTIMRTGWAPYRHGRWIWTVDGWYWDSYEPFGHIAFHYGRWYYDDYYGWIWIPDYEWAPAWVEWRYDDHYIGWAPLHPYAVFSINIGIHFTHDYYVPYHHWHYVTYNNFCDPYVYNHYVAPKYKYRIHSKTKVRNNYGYRNGHVVNNGIDIDVVRKRTGQNIRQRDIVRMSDYNEVERYRGKNDDVVRTFVASREDLTKSGNDLRDIKIERKDRKTTMDVSRVRIGRDVNDGNENIRNKERSAVRDNENKNDVNVNKKRNSDTRINKNNDIDIRKNESVKTERKKNDVFIPERKVERKDVRTNTPVKKEVIRKTEVKKETNNRTKIEQRKNEVRQNEVKTQKNIQRKVEVRKDNTNNTRTIGKKNNETKVQVRTKQQNNNQPKVKTQERKVERKTTSTNTEKRNTTEKRRR